MNRREVIAGLGGAAVWPLAARAQQNGRVRRIGVLVARRKTTRRHVGHRRFSAGYRASLGWSEGRNLRIDIRWGRRDADHIKPARKGADCLCPRRDRRASPRVEHGASARARAIPSCSSPLYSDPIGPASSPAWRGLAAISQALPVRVLTGASGWRCSNRSRRASRGCLRQPKTAAYDPLYFLTRGRGRFVASPSKLIARSGLTRRRHRTCHRRSGARADGGLLVLPDSFNRHFQSPNLNHRACRALPPAGDLRFPYFVAAGGLISYGD